MKYLRKRKCHENTERGVHGGLFKISRLAKADRVEREIKEVKVPISRCGGRIEMRDNHGVLKICNKPDSMTEIIGELRAIDKDKPVICLLKSI